MTVYPVNGARTIKRGRRTKAEVVELREALHEIVMDNEPVTVRGVFYLASSAGLVPKDDTKGYRPVQRELLKMRREGIIPWGYITDGSRTVYGLNPTVALNLTLGRSPGTTAAITGTIPPSTSRSGSKKRRYGG